MSDQVAAFLGPVLHAPIRGQVDYHAECLIVLDQSGRIDACLTPDDADFAPAITQAETQEVLRRLKPGEILIPGLIDLHVHAPQFPQLGAALDVPLEVWLQRHTFPLEARFADLDFAREHYAALVDTLLANGTTTAAYYATIHDPASRLLADICLDRGQRALVGRVAMDDPSQCPDFYRDASADEAIENTRAFIAYVRALPGNQDQRVMPVITPRFIPACTDALLNGLGQLAAETRCHIQTHCSESDWEHEFVHNRCGMSDTLALDHFGLLTRHSLLAHGNFLSRDDMAHIAQIGAGIAHCPLSNIYFSDAIFPLAQALALSVNVGLGTDISGGPSPSILDNARQAIHSARLLESGVDPAIPRGNRRREGTRITHLDAFWLATTGGGLALDLPIGLFQPGYHFDALVIDTRAKGTHMSLTGSETASELTQKLIYGATRANIAETWVGVRRLAANAVDE